VVYVRGHELAWLLDGLELQQTLAHQQLAYEDVV